MQPCWSADINLLLRTIRGLIIFSVPLNSLFLLSFFTSEVYQFNVEIIQWDFFRLLTLTGIIISSFQDNNCHFYTNIKVYLKIIIKVFHCSRYVYNTYTLYKYIYISGIYEKNPEKRYAFVDVNEHFKLFHFLNNSSKSYWTLQYIVQSTI